MRVSMRVDGGSQAPNTQEKDLADFLGAQAPLRGRIQLTAERQQANGISQSVATVLAEVGPAAVTTFGGALVAWIRHRTANTRVTVRRPDGTHFELSAQRVRGLGATELTELSKQLAAALTDPPQKQDP
jgi:membrane-associated two-gene conflict system component 1 (EACC1)